MFEKNRDKPTQNKQGLGLGLYIAKSIVELHHGKIEVYSVMGQGSIFKIYLPNAAT